MDKADKRFREECLKTHNDLRKRHGVPPLKLNKDINDIAQKWANELVRTNSFSHSKNRDYKGSNMGENIAMKYTSTGDDYTGEQVTDQWYSEITKYNFKANNGGGGTGSGGPSGAASRPAPSCGQVVREVDSGNRTTGGSYTKRVVTETIIGPDGQKRTVTRETVTSDGDPGAAETTRRFGSMGFDDRRTPGDQGLANRMQTTAVRDDKKGPPQSMDAFIADVVKSHNNFRRLHQVGDVKHNSEMSVMAQRWAEHLAKMKKLQHSSDTYQNQKLGENVASKWSSGGADYTGEEVTQQWYDEVKKFDFRNNDFTSGTGHFTQVVWKGSEEMGVGKAQTPDGHVFVVCNYRPAGNFMGRFRENVFPAKK